MVEAVPIVLQWPADVALGYITVRGRSFGIFLEGTALTLQRHNL